MKKIVSPFLFLSILFFACKKDSVLPSSTSSTNYFPLRVGQFTVFDVDSIRFFDVTMTSDTARYQVKEWLDSSFIDNTGNKAYRLNRMRRKNDSAVWVTTDFWIINSSPTTAEKVEENLRFIKLLYPVEDGKNWNGNAYISTTGNLSYLADWNYIYSDANLSKRIGSFNFDSTVTVTAQNLENLIKKDLEQEMYAANYGMVYKISMHVSKQNVANSWAKPEKGYIIKMTAKEIRR